MNKNIKVRLTQITNPGDSTVLMSGELGVTLGSQPEDTVIKVGDGINQYSDLSSIGTSDSKLDASNPTSTGLFTHEGNGSSTDTVVKIRSNNGYLLGSSDASSSFHLSGVPVACDTSLILNAGMIFNTLGQNLDTNGSTISNVQSITHRGSKGVVQTGCDYNDGTITDASNCNFVVKNSNITTGYGPTSYSFSSYSGSDLVFGVDTSGGVSSVGSIKATSFDISSSRKVKKDIQDTQVEALKLLNEIKVVDFKYKKDRAQKQRIGLIAEDSPDLVVSEKHDAMDTGNVLGVLIKAVQELNEKLDHLNKKVELLEKEI